MNDIINTKYSHELGDNNIDTRGGPTNKNKLKKTKNKLYNYKSPKSYKKSKLLPLCGERGEVLERLSAASAPVGGLGLASLWELAYLGTHFLHDHLLCFASPQRVVAPQQPFIHKDGGNGGVAILLGNIPLHRASLEGVPRAIHLHHLVGHAHLVEDPLGLLAGGAGLLGEHQALILLNFILDRTLQLHGLLLLFARCLICVVHSHCGRRHKAEGERRR